MLREEYKFNDYIQKKASEEKRRKKDANDGFWIRTAAFQLGSALGRMFIGC